MPSVNLPSLTDFLNKVNNNRAEASLVVAALATYDGVRPDSVAGATLAVLVAAGLVVAQILETRLAVLASKPAPTQPTTATA